MPAPRNLLSAGLCSLVLLPAAVGARPPVFDLSMLDPLATVMAAEDLLLRAPERDVDQLFLALHAASRSESEAAALCAMFDGDAPRDLSSLQRTANALGPESRQRFVDALAMVAISGMQHPRQPYAPAAGSQAVKSAGARAAFLHDGFAEGMSAVGDDADSRALRCRSFRWLVGALERAPVPERVAATRFLLSEGLAAYRNTL